MRLLRTVASAANEAASPDEALRAAVDEACTVLRWPVGHVFLPTAGGERLASTSIWHFDDAARYGSFADATARIEFAKGVGMPGRVLAEARPVFVTDFATVSLPRGAAALEVGLRSAFGCPVMVGAEVVAVLEFFSPKTVSADPQLLEVMADVGKQLGRAFERDRAQRATAHLALHDALTDLPNRHLLDDRLAQAIALAHRDDRPVGLLFIDLDDFKLINDTFGHHAGDVVLREVASRLSAALREQDTVARLGGDEFAVVLPNTDRAGALDAAMKVRRSLDPAVVVEGQRCRAGATVGIAVYPLDAGSAVDLVRRADIALYSAKARRSGVAMYDPQIDEYTRERIALVDELRHGIEAGELLCHYQPELRLRGGEVVALEALVRWRHGRRGLLLPADFVPLAQRGGLIRDLTRRVLADAVAKARALELAGHDIVVAMNVSVADVLDREMPDIVGAAVRAAKIDPRHLQVELTETHLLADLDLAVENMRALRRMGIRCALDDFGTGYASLGYLGRLPIDQLKVDGSLVARMADDRTSAAIVKAALMLGTDLGFEVVAEGVENDEIRRRLLDLGCEIGQGFALARPMPDDELAEWLRGDRALARAS